MGKPSKFIIDKILTFMNNNTIKLNPEISIGYTFFIFIHIGLVWLLPYFPTQDGPSHIYNLFILKDLLNGGMEWGRYFSYNLHASPNLAFNLLSYSMLHFFPPLIVEKIFLSIYIVLMGVSVYLFLCTFNKASLPFIFFVFPVIFNFNLFMGFYSYVITVSFFLLAFSSSWKLRNRSATYKFLFFNLTGYIIFYSHIIPFIFYLLALFCINIAQYEGFKRIIIDQIKLIFIISPSLLVLFIYLFKGQIGSFPDLSYLSSISRYSYLINDLFFFSTITFSPWQVFPGCLFTCLFLTFFILSVFLIIRISNEGWVKIRDISASDKVLICLSSIFLLIYFITPFRFGGGDFFNQRFPWVIFIILLPLLRINESLISKRFVLVSSASVAIIFFVFNATILHQQSNNVEVFLSGLNSGIPKGAYVMTYKKIDPESGWPRIDALMHAASYYGIFKGCVDIGNYETGHEYFFVKFKDNIQSFPSINQIENRVESIKWSEYPSVQYLLGWEVDKNDTDKLSKFFHVIYKHDPFSLWERNLAESYKHLDLSFEKS